MGKKTGFIKGEIKYPRAGKEEYFIKVQLLASDMRLIRTGYIKNRNFVFLRIRPGIYLLRLSLPSGAKMEQVIEVKARRKTMALFDLAAYSLEENHEWAYFSKNTRYDYNIRPIGAKKNLIEFFSVSGSLWSYSNGKWETSILENMQTQFITEPGITYDIIVDQHLHALEIRGDTITSQIIYLPPGDTIRCLLRPASLSDEPFHQLKIIIASEYTQAETLLTLFSRGAYDEAQLIYSSNQKFKLSLKGNPIEAIIRSYYLIKTKSFNVAKREVEQFADTFNWIPDTAIIFAWRLSFLKPGEFRIIEFGDWIIKAWRRGIPIYTAGLVLLYNGLKYLNNHYKKTKENDFISKEIPKVLLKVEELVRQADLNQELTTIFGINPGSFNPPPQIKKAPGNMRPTAPAPTGYRSRKKLNKKTGRKNVKTPAQIVKSSAA